METLVGWKAIAAALETTSRSCRRYAKRRRDPLPVYRRLGTIVIARSALEDWRARQTVSYQLERFQRPAARRSLA